MAAYDTAVYTTQTDGTNSIDTATRGQDLGGKLRVAFAGITANTAWVQNDTINIVKLPAGSRVLAVVVDQSAAAGASVTLSITGNDGSARTFVSAYDNNTTFNAFKPSEYTSPLAIETTIVATLAAANPTDNVTYEFGIFYTTPNS